MRFRACGGRWLLWPTAVVLITCIVYSLVSCLVCARDHGVRELGYARAVCGLVPTTMLWCLTGAQFALAVGLADFCVAPNQHTVRVFRPALSLLLPCLARFRSDGECPLPPQKHASRGSSFLWAFRELHREPSDRMIARKPPEGSLC